MSFVGGASISSHGCPVPGEAGAPALMAKIGETSDPSCLTT